MGAGGLRRTCIMYCHLCHGVKVQFWLCEMRCRWVTRTSWCRPGHWWSWSRAGVPAVVTPTRCASSACRSLRQRCSSCRPGRRKSIYSMRPSQPSSRSTVCIVLSRDFSFPSPFVPRLQPAHFLPSSTFRFDCVVLILGFYPCGDFSWHPVVCILKAL